MLIAHNNYKNKNTLITGSLFLIFVAFITFVILFYISNNIILSELGYKFIKLENSKVQLEEQNKKLELTVETLSALDRIEKIACNNLGMSRPKNVEYIALNPTSKINQGEGIGVISNNYKGKKYFLASFDLKKINDLILGSLK
jgi:cell division protein FtsL